jgi:hypothetical protein
MRKFYIGMIIVGFFNFILSFVALLFSLPDHFSFVFSFSTIFHFLAIREYTKNVVEIQNLE